jgi:transcriptional regulator with XRE-family HTH domain
MATLTEKFGLRIRELRKKQGLTQEKLAELAKMDYSYLNLIEAGKRNPSLKRVAKLARVLKISLSELFKF